MRDTDTLRANGDLLDLLNLLADFALPLNAGDELSVQIARILGEVAPRYSRHGAPNARDSLADALAFVCTLADGQCTPMNRTPAQAGKPVRRQTSGDNGDEYGTFR
jgi:hypothetical protein